MNIPTKLPAHATVKRPGYRVETEVLRHVHLPVARISGTVLAGVFFLGEFLILWAGATILSEAIAIACGILLPVVLVALRFWVPSTRMTEEQQKELVIDPGQDYRIEWVSGPSMDYPSVRRVSKAQRALEDAKARHTLPQRWSNNVVVPLYGSLTEGSNESYSAMKTSREEAVILRHVCISEDEAWMSNFRKAMEMH